MLSVFTLYRIACVSQEEVRQLAKNRMTFEKQLRETKKKQKAAEKRADRRKLKDEPKPKPSTFEHGLDDRLPE